MSTETTPSALRDVFISLGCNREPAVMDWNHSLNLIAYGGSSAVAVYNPDDDVNAVVGTLRGHTDDINSVKWLSIPRPPDTASDSNACFLGELISGGFDGKIIVWDILQSMTSEYSPKQLKPSASSEKSLQYTISAQLSLSKEVDAITSITSVHSKGTSYIAGCSASGLVHVWVRQDADSTRSWAHVQTFEYNTAQIMQSAAFAEYTFDDGAVVVILALGGVDTRIHLFSCSDAAAPTPFMMMGTLDGHIDWIRSLAFCHTDPRSGASSLLLASASQDKSIRLWCIAAPSADTKQFLDEHTGAAVDDTTRLMASSTLGERGHLFTCGSEQAPRLVAAHLESILVGHEEWVLGAHWHPVVDGKQPMALLTVSADKTMMMWEPDASYGSSLWVSALRVGEVGGNTLGLFGACFGPRGASVIGVGYSGSFHLWRRRDASEWYSVPTVSGHNKPVVDVMVCAGDKNYTAFTGKQGDARALPYLMSASSDQSVRAFAPWMGRASQPQPDMAAVPWFEIARPQVHGWDLTALAPVPGCQHAYVCASEEKLMRVFNAPVPFIGSLYSLANAEGFSPAQLVKLFQQNSKAQAIADAEAAGDSEADNGLSSLMGDFSAMNLVNSSRRALSATMPALGLSNKAVQEGDAVMDENAKFPNGEVNLMFVDAELHTGLKQVFASQPPVEEELVSCSLWPEVEKLYGHGYDLSCVATCVSAPVLASAAHSRKTKNAAIRLWDTRTWVEYAQIVAHGSTITQMAFSPGNKVRFGAPLRAHGHGYAADAASVDTSVDKYLVSVSRDQQYAVYRRSGAETDYKPMVSAEAVLDTEGPCPQYLLTDMKKSHTRQVYAVTWCDDGKSFFTSSRDKHAKYWRVGDDGHATCVQTIDFPAAATAMVSSHVLHQGKLVMLLVAGFDSGILHVYKRAVCDLEHLSDAALDESTAEWTLLSAVDAHMCHSAAITRLITLPRVAEEPLVVASASVDHSVRVFQLQL